MLGVGYVGTGLQSSPMSFRSDRSRRNTLSHFWWQTSLRAWPQLFFKISGYIYKARLYTLLYDALNLNSLLLCCSATLLQTNLLQCFSLNSSLYYTQQRRTVSKFCSCLFPSCKLIYWMKWPRTRICSNTAGDLFMLWKRFISLLLSTLSLAQCISMSTAGRSLDPPLEASRTKILLKPQVRELLYKTKT